MKCRSYSDTIPGSSPLETVGYWWLTFDFTHSVHCPVQTHATITQLILRGLQIVCSHFLMDPIPVPLGSRIQGFENFIVICTSTSTKVTGTQPCGAWHAEWNTCLCTCNDEEQYISMTDLCTVTYKIWGIMSNPHNIQYSAKVLLDSKSHFTATSAIPHVF